MKFPPFLHSHLRLTLLGTPPNRVFLLYEFFLIIISIICIINALHISPFANRNANVYQRTIDSIKSTQKVCSINRVESKIQIIITRAVSHNSHYHIAVSPCPYIICLWSVSKILEYKSIFFQTSKNYVRFLTYCFLSVSGYLDRLPPIMENKTLLTAFIVFISLNIGRLEI